MRRPLCVSLFAWILAGVSAWNAVRFLGTLLFWHVLTQYGARPGPIYIAASGAFWLAFGILLVRAWLKGDAWAWPGACGFSLGYGLWYWLDRLFAQGPRPTWPFALGVTVILLVPAAICLLSRRTRLYFRREDHERDSETPAAS